MLISIYILLDTLLQSRERRNTESPVVAGPSHVANEEANGNRPESAPATATASNEINNGASQDPNLAVNQDPNISQTQALSQYLDQLYRTRQIMPGTSSSLLAAAAAAAGVANPIPSTSNDLIPLTQTLGINIAERVRLQFEQQQQESERNAWMLNNPQAAAAAAIAAASANNSELDGRSPTMTPPAAPGPSTSHGYYEAGAATAAGGLAALAAGGSLASASGLEIAKLYSAEKLVGRKSAGRKPGDKAKIKGSPASQNLCYNRKYIKPVQWSS